MGAWEITRKDLRLLMRDRRAFAVLLAFPLALIAILGPSAGRMLNDRDGDRTRAQERESTHLVKNRGANSSQPAARDAAAEEIANREAVYRTIVPAYTVFFAFFLVNVMARSFVAERELGTLRRLQLSPITPAGLLVGKTLPFWLVSVVQSGALFLLGHFVFGMPWGPHPWLLVPVIVCLAFAATAMGLLVATVVRTDAQISAYANLLVITTAGVSGCFMPRDWLPPLLQQISLATPHAWAIIAFDEILEPNELRYFVVIRSCVLLLAFAGVFFLAGRLQFQRCLEERR